MNSTAEINSNAARSTSIDKDILIVGGGMVGASMACALANLGYRIGVIEAFAFSRPSGSTGQTNNQSNMQPSFDARSIALAEGSRRIFDTLGLWDDMVDSACPIQTIHISDQGHWGNTRLRAEEMGVDGLGYVIENRAIGAALMAKLDRSENVELIAPANLIGLQADTHHARAIIEKESHSHSLSARLIIAADGGNSAVRKLLSIGTDQTDYDQTAIIANVGTNQNHQQIAYERFTRTGPLALLPMTGDKRYSLVLTVKQNQAHDILSLDDENFLALLQARFGFRAGRFVRTSKRHAYPLSLVRIQKHTDDRVVFIGNAAHTLHPVAGQGFNLGIRDVAALAQVLADAKEQSQDPGETSTLTRYEQWRLKDQDNVARITDSLVKIFSNDLFPLNRVRSKGLIATNLMPAAKTSVARHAMGLSGRMTKLARGIPL